MNKRWKSTTRKANWFYAKVKRSNNHFGGPESKAISIKNYLPTLVSLLDPFLITI
jgi:hypothetical protein